MTNFDNTPVDATEAMSTKELFNKINEAKKVEQTPAEMETLPV